MSAIQTGISLLDGLISKSKKFKIDLSQAKSVSIYSHMVSMTFTFSDELHNTLAEAGFEFKAHEPGVMPHIMAVKNEENFTTMIFLFY